MSNGNVLDKQTAEFGARVLQNLPEISTDIMQGWIKNPKALKKVLAEALCPPTKHTIDLGASPQLPFDTAEVVKHEGKGIVEIELRSDDNLYIDGKKVVLHLSEGQKGDKRIVGHELRQELESGEQVLLNGNVLDYLYDHPELFPEHWKKDENGATRYIFFWGSIFRGPADGRLYARGLYWHDGVLYRSDSGLDDDWNRRSPSASLAS